MIKQAELQQAYNLGRQAALEKLAAESVSLEKEIKRRALADAPSNKGMSGVPYRNPRIRDMASKYDMSMDEIEDRSAGAKQYADNVLRFGRALGENNSPRAFGLPHNNTEIPYRPRR